MGIVHIELTEEMYENILKSKALMETYTYTAGSKVGKALKEGFDNHIALIQDIEKGKK